jgi:hypothetical protein
VFHPLVALVSRGLRHLVGYRSLQSGAKGFKEAGQAHPSQCPLETEPVQQLESSRMTERCYPAFQD